MIGNFLIQTPHSVAKYATKVAKEGWKLIAVCNSAVKKGSVEMQISAYFERETPASPPSTTPVGTTAEQSPPTMSEIREDFSGDPKVFDRPPTSLPEGLQDNG